MRMQHRRLPVVVVCVCVCGMLACRCQQHVWPCWIGLAAAGAGAVHAMGACVVCACVVCDMLCAAWFAGPTWTISPTAAGLTWLLSTCCSLPAATSAVAAPAADTARQQHPVCSYISYSVAHIRYPVRVSRQSVQCRSKAVGPGDHRQKHVHTDGCMGCCCRARRFVVGLL